MNLSYTLLIALGDLIPLLSLKANLSICGIPAVIFNSSRENANISSRIFYAACCLNAYFDVKSFNGPHHGG